MRVRSMRGTEVEGEGQRAMTHIVQALVRERPALAVLGSVDARQRMAAATATLTQLSIGTACLCSKVRPALAASPAVDAARTFQGLGHAALLQSLAFTQLHHAPTRG